MLVLLDAGVGNLRSVGRALAHVGARELCVSGDPDTVRRASRLVLPGQGAFGDFAAALDRDGGALREAVLEVLTREVPYLGLCLGLQLLFESSEEAPGARGLGVFAGTVRRFGDERPDGAGGSCKVPQMGWNRVEPTAAGSPLLERDWFYFVHSYYADPADPSVVAAWCDYGGPFAAAVRRASLLAVQFHPEKSQGAGLALLERWLRTS